MKIVLTFCHVGTVEDLQWGSVVNRVVISLHANPGDRGGFRELPDQSDVGYIDLIEEFDLDIIHHKGVGGISGVADNVRKHCDTGVSTCGSVWDCDLKSETVCCRDTRCSFDLWSTHCFVGKFQYSVPCVNLEYVERRAGFVSDLGRQLDSLVHFNLQNCGIAGRESDGGNIGPGGEVHKGHNDDTSEAYHVHAVEPGTQE